MQRIRPHVSQVQKEYLLKYLLQHPRLTNPKFSSDFTVKDAQMEWRALSYALNHLPGKGSVKNWKQWRKAWQDLKSKTKIKYHQQRGSLTREERLVIKICRESVDDSQLLAEEDLDAEIDEDSIDKFIKICPETDEDNKERISEVKNIPENILIQIIPSQDQQDVSGDQHMDDEYFAENQSEEKYMIKGEESDSMMDNHDSVGLDRQHSDKKKPNSSSSSYHDQKLYYLSRIARAKERSAWAKVRIAEALEKLASSTAVTI